jgi:GNAT superfamily N-acetyltransferase
VGFEPDSKMNQPKSQANVKKIVAGLKKGDKLPPLLVRKYKDGYQVLDGHHRFWAYKLSGTKSIPVRIVADKDIEEISKQGVAEAFNQPYSLQWENGEFGDYDAYTKLPDGSNLSIMFNKEDDDVYAIEFWRNNSQDATGDGDSQKVFATVLSAIQEFLTTKAQPRFISFTGAKGEDDEGKDSRVSLYSKLLQRYATSWGYKLKNVFDRADEVVFDLVRIKQDVAEGTESGDFNLMGQNLFLKNLARNLQQRYPDATVKLSSDRVTAYHNEEDDEALSVMGGEVMDSGYIGVGIDDAFTESFQGVLVPTIKQTTEQLLAANPGTRPALFLSTDNWNPDAWTHITNKLGYRLIADDEELDEQGVVEVVNKELWHPERMFKQRVPIGDYEFEAREAIGGMGDYDANALTIIAYDPKKKNKIIGNANFVVKGRGSKRSLASDDTYVDPKYRGEGIATMMYAYAKSLGNDIKGSNIQTPMGKKMWANWGSDAEHLKGNK